MYKIRLYPNLMFKSHLDTDEALSSFRLLLCFRISARMLVARSSNSFVDVISRDARLLSRVLVYPPRDRHVSRVTLKLQPPRDLRSILSDWTRDTNLFSSFSTCFPTPIFMILCSLAGFGGRYSFFVLDAKSTLL